MSTPDVTLLGVGKMGVAFVERWVAAGKRVGVWNRTAERSQALATSHVEPFADVDAAVSAVPVVVSMLTDGRALRSVLIDQGAIAAMAPGSCLIDLSTVDVASSERVAEVADRHGVLYVRGAVSGTPAVVRAGAAGLLLSGPSAALDAAHGTLSGITEQQVVVGEREESRVVKLAVNLMLAGTMELLAEAVVLAEASGVSREILLGALDTTVMSSRFVSYKGAALTARDYAATFRTIDMKKDVTLALDQARASGVPLPIGNEVNVQLGAACDQGWADDDFMSLVRLLQTRGGRPVD